MKILICGAHGFIGRTLEQALHAAGHTVLGGVRTAQRETDIVFDYQQGTDTAWWRPHLQDIDVVINAVGIIAEQGEQRFNTLHIKAPKALFDACLESKVKHIIQISALGASEEGETAYLRSKAAADRYLQTLPIPSTILNPSLIFGPGGKSSRLFTWLASLPVCFLPGKGDQWVQPVHIDDLAETVARLLNVPFPPQQLNVVGPRPVQYAEMLRVYRTGLGLSPAPAFNIPEWSLHLCACLWGKDRGGMLNVDTLKMLKAGNIADSAALTALLNRPLRAIETFTAPATAPTWIPRLLHATLAALWAGTAFVSVSPSGLRIGLALAEQSGIPSSLAPLALYGGAALDLVMGILSLLRPTAALWYGQIGVVFSYTLFITLQLPEQWLHPFGPVLKNLPVLALLIVLLSLPYAKNISGGSRK